MILFLALIALIYFSIRIIFRKTSVSLSLVCQGSFSGAPGTNWAPYIFTCVDGECSYTNNGIEGLRPVFSYSIDVVTLNFSPPNPPPDGAFFYVLINCTGKSLCAKKTGGGEFSLANNAIGPEFLSLANDSGIRQYVIEEGLCPPPPQGAI